MNANIVFSFFALMADCYDMMKKLSSLFWFGLAWCRRLAPQLTLPSHPVYRGPVGRMAPTPARPPFPPGKGQHMPWVSEVPILSHCE